MLRRFAYPHMLWYVSVSSLLGILIGVEVGAQGKPGAGAAGMFPNEFRFLL